MNKNDITSSNEASLQNNDSQSDVYHSDIECDKCQSNKVIESQPKGAEVILMSFLPRRVYQCEHCHHRFWSIEALFDYPRRSWTWAIVFLVVVLAIVLKYQFAISSQSKPNGNIGLNQQLELTPQFEPSLPTPLDEIPNAETDQIEASNSEQVSTPSIDQVANIGITTDDALTPEQLQAKLEVAKAQADHASRLSQHRQVLLNNELNKDQQALESILRVDIKYRIDRWRNAWQAGQADYYLSFYSDKFIPASNLPFDDWVAQRKQRIVPSKKIELKLTDYHVQFSEQNMRSTVEFDQEYRSGSYFDRSRKQLILVKEQQDWKIISEIELSN